MTRPRLALALAMACGLALALLLARWRPQAEHAGAAAGAPRPTPGSGDAGAGASASASPIDGGSRVAGPALDAGPDANEAPACPADMVVVSGTFCPFVAHRCARYLGAHPEPGEGVATDGDGRRCSRFRNELLCEGRPRLLRFCIDRFEYPNLAGVEPVVMVDARQAREACAVEHKRLCEAEEWAFACEGPRTLPYPHGLERGEGVCNVDRRLRAPDHRALASPWQVSVELDRLDGRVGAGARPACVSPFGASDMTGNVLEWVHDRRDVAPGKSGAMAAAGGHWGRVAATCRSLDRSLPADQRSHLLGFRCCRNTLDGAPARRMAPTGARLPHRRKLLE